MLRTNVKKFVFFSTFHVCDEDEFSKIRFTPSGSSPSTRPLPRPRVGGANSGKDLTHPIQSLWTSESIACLVKGLFFHLLTSVVPCSDADQSQEGCMYRRTHTPVIHPPPQHPATPHPPPIPPSLLATPPPLPLRLHLVLYLLLCRSPLACCKKKGSKSPLAAIYFSKLLIEQFRNFFLQTLMLRYAAF